MKPISKVMALMLFLIAPTAFAQGSFTLHLPVLDYSDSSTVSKSSGASDQTVKKITLNTAQRENAYLGATIENWAFYYYPLADSQMVSLSYVLNEVIEIGADLGLNNVDTDRPKNETSNDIFGLFAGYLLPISPSVTGEFYLFLSQAQSKSTERDAANTITAKSDSTENAVKLTADATIPLSKNTSYVGGISYKSATTDDKESKTKSTSGTFGIRLAAIRLSF